MLLFKLQFSTPSFTAGRAGECSGWWQRSPVEPEAEETSHPSLPQIQQREVRVHARQWCEEMFAVCSSCHYTPLLSSSSVSLFPFLCFSSPSSVRSLRPLWCNMSCVLTRRGSVTVCCLCELLVFAGSHTVCKQTAFPLANASARLQNCAQGKGGDRETDAPSLFLSLLVANWTLIIWVTYSAFEAVPLLGHRCEQT